MLKKKEEKHRIQLPILETQSYSQHQPEEREREAMEETPSLLKALVPKQHM